MQHRRARHGSLYALGVDNCLITVNGPEFPILDGSSLPYVQHIEKVGIIEQNSPKNFYVIKKKIEVRDENSDSSIIILPDEEFSITTMISFDSQYLSSQFATLDDMSKFSTEIAPARTFCVCARN